MDGEIKWFKDRKPFVPSDKETVAIVSNGDRLICHYFVSEKEAIRLMPRIRRKDWKRETWDSRHIRYHHDSALKFWNKLDHRKSFRATSIHYKDGKKLYEYH